MDDAEQVLRAAGMVVEAEACRAELEALRVEMKTLADSIWLQIYGPRE